MHRPASKVRHTRLRRRHPRCDRSGAELGRSQLAWSINGLLLDSRSPRDGRTKCQAEEGKGIGRLGDGPTPSVWYGIDRRFFGIDLADLGHVNSQALVQAWHVPRLLTVIFIWASIPIRMARNEGWAQAPNNHWLMPCVIPTSASLEFRLSGCRPASSSPFL